MTVEDFANSPRVTRITADLIILLQSYTAKVKQTCPQSDIEDLEVLGCLANAAEGIHDLIERANVKDVMKPSRKS